MGTPDHRVPRLVEGVDLTTLELTPFEGFVLSRVDGEVAVAELADMVGLDEGEVLALLERLIGEGALEWRRETVSLPRATGREVSRAAFRVEPEEAPSPPPRASTRRNQPRGRVRLTRSALTPAPGRYAASESSEDRVEPSRRAVHSPRASHTGVLHPPGLIEEDEGEPQSLEELAAALSAVTEELSGDHPAVSVSEPPAPSEPEPAPEVEPEPEPEVEIALDPARRQRIDDLFAAVDELDHYQVLGVPRTAERKDIRHCYFTLSKVFHPDTMFGRELGPYRARMGTIFQRITEAYEVLGKKKQRHEYDRYLELSDRTRAVEAAINPDPALDARIRRGEAAARGEAEASGATPAEGIERPALPPSEPPRLPPPRARTSRAPTSEEARARAKQLMAKKLRHATRVSASPRPARTSAPPPSTVAIGRDNVLRGLARSLRDTAHHTGGLDRVARHERSAERAEREGDLATAANHYRLALSLAPERRDLAARHDVVNGVLAAELAGAYEEQARYEERHGKWAAAALSWGKVVEGRPDDPAPARHAAECLLEAKGDLHRAKELAQRAVDLDGEDIRSLRTLAQVFVAAGLGLNARRVLQRAAELDPKDEIVENLLRDLEV